MPDEPTPKRTVKEPKIIQIMPADCWFIEVTGAADYPVACFALYGDGTLKALCVTSQGVFMDATRMPGFVRLFNRNVG